MKNPEIKLINTADVEGHRIGNEVYLTEKPCDGPRPPALNLGEVGDYPVGAKITLTQDGRDG